jgi:hypothetical protein
MINGLYRIGDELTSTIERLDHGGDATLAERATKLAAARRDRRSTGELKTRDQMNPQS